jgi:hypothetical protein
MGMHLGLVSLADANIERVLKTPALAWKLIVPDDSASGEAPPPKPVKTAAKAKKTTAAKKAPAKAKATTTLKLADTEGTRCDLAKSWHGIHYLLTGSAWEGSPPFDFLVDGGQQVGKIDVNHGPLRAFSGNEVKTIYENISGIGPYELRKRFNARDMAAKEIYPDIWTKAGQEEDSLRYLMDSLDKLRAFLRKTIDAELGVLIFLV